MKNSRQILLILLATSLKTSSYPLNIQLNISEIVEDKKLPDRIFQVKFNETKKVAKQDEDEGGGLGEVIGNVVDGAAAFASNVLTNGFRPGHLLAEAAEGLPGDAGESVSGFLTGAADPINQLFNNEVQGVYDLIVGTTPKPTPKPKPKTTTPKPKPTTPPLIYLLPTKNNPSPAAIDASLSKPQQKPATVFVPSKIPVNQNVLTAVSSSLQTTKRPNLNQQSDIIHKINAGIENSKKPASVLNQNKPDTSFSGGLNSANSNLPEGGTSLQSVSNQLSGVNKVAPNVAPSSLSGAQSLSNSLEEGSSSKLSLSNALELSNTAELVHKDLAGANKEAESNIPNITSSLKNASSQAISIPPPIGKVATPTNVVPPVNTIPGNGGGVLGNRLPSGGLINPGYGRPPFPPGFNRFPIGGNPDDEDEDSEDEDNELGDSKAAKRKIKIE